MVLPSFSTRHALRDNHPDGHELEESDYAGGEDMFNNNGGHTNQDRRHDPANLRESYQRRYSSDADEDVKEPSRSSSLNKSSTLVDALSDPKSELAKFLLADSVEDEQHGLFEGFFDNSLFKSFKNIGNRAIFNEDTEVRSQRTSKAWFYSLALESMDVRKDRIIMLAEAYSIFGALFLAGTWVLYEWGSGYGYGGCRFEETQFCHPNVDRAFELVMALAITANLFQAMFSSFLWLMSVLFSGSHKNWVYGARNLLVVCHTLLTTIFVLTILGVGLGIYAKLVPHWPEVAIALTFLLVVSGYGIYTTSMLVAEECALEYFHFPTWFKWGILPYPMLRRGGRKRIRELAEKRAKEVRARAYSERTQLRMDSKTSTRSIHHPTTSIGHILRDAADAIGRVDTDISVYELRLEEDWYNKASELANMSVETLAKYMPRRLAEEVHNELAMKELTKAGGLRTSHIISGSFTTDSDDAQRERTVRFG